MKKYILSVLIPCYLLHIFGCYSLSTIKSEKDISDFSSGGLSVIFTLDNYQIRAKSDDCILVNNHRLVVYGNGILIDKNTRQLRPFQGQLNEESIDSLKNIYIGSVEGLICWLKDSTRISFNKGNYAVFSLNPDSSYWLIKNFEKPYQINVANVREVQVQKVNIIGLIFIGTLIGGFIYLMIELYQNFPHFSITDR